MRPSTSRPTLHPLSLAAIAPLTWGTTYIVVAQLPQLGPLTLATLRATLAGLALMLVVRRMPSGDWWWKSALLGFFNFTLFFATLFFAAQHLPGGVAATLGAVQPFLIMLLLFGQPRPSSRTIGRATLGLLGVALLVLGPTARLDTLGVLVGLLSVLTAAVGSVLAKTWLPQGEDVLAITTWQMLAGGLLLLPVTVGLEGIGWQLSLTQSLMLGYLILVGTALAYSLWFRGIVSASPVQVSLLARLSPATAMLIDLLTGRSLSWPQWLGLALIAISLVPD